MFPESFETVFWIVFILSLAFIAFWWVIAIIRVIRGKQGLQGQVAGENQPIVKEREIIREIVKIRCPYCNNIYDETLDKCPYCGGKKS
jgi:hypothetical protein